MESSRPTGNLCPNPTCQQTIFKEQDKLDAEIYGKDGLKDRVKGIESCVRSIANSRITPKLFISVVGGILIPFFVFAWWFGTVVYADRGYVDQGDNEVKVKIVDLEKSDVEFIKDIEHLREGFDEIVEKMDANQKAIIKELRRIIEAGPVIPQ